MAVSQYDRIPEAALDWHREGGAALATVIRTWGSAPRPAGSQLAVARDGEMAGSVSGGCVEGAVVAEALEALDDGTPRVLEFGVSDEDAFAVGLACGGRIEVLVEPVGTGKGIPERFLGELAEARGGKRAVAQLTNTATWERRISDGSAAGELEAAVRGRLRGDRSGREGDWFACIHNPPLRMIVVGGSHIAQPLTEMAALAGYECVVADPRDAFASPSRFPGVRIVRDWPDEAVRAEAPDSRTAVVTLTHDPKLDDPAIGAALESDAFYLGCLGSTRTHAKRVERLAAAGIGSSEIAKIHAPVGLDLGAQSPAEIAVAILAEITARLRRDPADG